MNIKNTDLIVIAGKRGEGKTTLFKSIHVNAKSDPNFYKDENGVSLNPPTMLRVIDPLMELKDIGGEFVRYGDRNTYDKILQQCFNRKNVFLETDEADRFFPNKENLTNVESDFIQVGRHWGLGGCFITRRLARLHTDVISQANKLFIFKLTSAADLRYFSECGFGEYVDYFSQLEKHEFLVIDTDTNEVYISPPI